MVVFREFIELGEFEAPFAGQVLGGVFAGEIGGDLVAEPLVVEEGGERGGLHSALKSLEDKAGVYFAAWPHDAGDGAD